MPEKRKELRGRGGPGRGQGRHGLVPGEETKSLSTRYPLSKIAELKKYLGEKEIAELVRDLLDQWLETQREATPSPPNA